MKKSAFKHNKINPEDRAVPKKQNYNMNTRYIKLLHSL
jgi:hypothetical protein